MSSFNVRRNFDYFAKKYCLSRLELLQDKQKNLNLKLFSRLSQTVGVGGLRRRQFACPKFIERLVPNGIVGRNLETKRKALSQIPPHNAIVDEFCTSLLLNLRKGNRSRYASLSSRVPRQPSSKQIARKEIIYHKILHVLDCISNGQLKPYDSFTRNAQHCKW